ncbi:GGDEF domain-containing protein [Tahibacter amnicola]|uniref:diguanylate cyclase n=1 Tax=Tahibacter amnicola TaxID=2976241 RepID=A0ABY6BD58_9GAMM|nr:GGDEF domain-containing protein [Tahibacter amnicola]UXI67153.1 GGDEF domain-containing protein [Tahibacter amnicola]
MTTSLDSIFTMAVWIPAAGAAVIGLQAFLLHRVTRQAPLRLLAIAWAAAALAPLFLVLAATVPGLRTPGWLASLAATTAFTVAQMRACALLAGTSRRWAGLPGVLPLVVGIVLIARDVPYSLQTGLLVYGSLLACAQASAAWQLWRRAIQPAGVGLATLRLALLAQAAMAFFGAVELARTLPAAAPSAGLVFPVFYGLSLLLVACGLAVATLEDNTRSWALRNRHLLADNRRFRVEAEQDALTGARNRHAFFHLMDEFAALKLAINGVVAVVDVDNMKTLNDEYGHEGGDAALVRVAQAMRALVRRDDHLFRWGGDEFLLVAVTLDLTEFRQRLESLNARLQQPEPAVRVSFGCAEFGKASELNDAVHRADMAMYEQKRRRKNPPRDCRGISSTLKPMRHGRNVVA